MLKLKLVMQKCKKTTISLLENVWDGRRHSLTIYSYKNTFIYKRFRELIIMVKNFNLSASFRPFQFKCTY